MAKNTKTPTLPTRKNLREAVRWVTENTNRVPCLWGPTASGKTFMINEVARESGAEVITVLTQHETPDTVAGFQANIGGSLVQMEPEWFRQAREYAADQKHVYLLFDEIGRARAETHGALLTFFRERELHGKYLDPDYVHVVAATNPAQFDPAFRTRMLFLYVPADADYLLQILEGSTFGLDVLGAAPTSLPEGSEDDVYTNTPPPAPPILDASGADVITRFDKSFWVLEEGTRHAIMTGIIPAAALDVALSATDDSRIKGLPARNPDLLGKILPELNAPDMTAAALDLMSQYEGMNSEEVTDAHYKILDSVYGGKIDRLEQFLSATKPTIAMEQLARKADADKLFDLIGDKIQNVDEKLTGIWYHNIERQIKD